ncbi:MAG: hypothetical protein J1E38_07755 [Paramuribaculum sp.]|nr:hypothetical protein [Paramuribaculum sp.]
MENNVYLFNPENDIALASGRSNFTPSSEPKQLARDGSLLPFWWASDDDAVLTSPENQAAVSKLKQKFGLKGQIFNPHLHSAYTPSPWGWSHFTKGLFAKAGINAVSLPSVETLDAIRQLSHRNLTIKIHNLIGTDKDKMPVEATSLENAITAIERWDNDAVVKQPWSSSGRGIFYTRSLSREKLSEYIKGFIRRQGSVMIEKRREKVKDFALLFMSEPSGINYVGLSVFLTSPTGEYMGNLIETDDKLQTFIGHDITDIMTKIKNALSRTIHPNYYGPVGVDMMIETTDDNEEKIAACVEVNLRMTMGFLAHRIAMIDDTFRGNLLYLTKGTLSTEEIDLSPIADSKYHYVLSKKGMIINQ